MNNNNTNSNPFDEYSSKIKRVNIELPDYKFFHSPSKEDHVDSRFIGREKIINKFKSILNNNETMTGAYLVTGYRGMGKSSLVSKVMNELTKRFTIEWFFFFGLIISFFLIHIFLFDYEDGFPIKNRIIFSLLFWLISISYIILKFHKYCNCNIKKHIKYSLPKLFNKISFKKHVRSKNRIILKLNLGHEILNEIDILSLIATNVKSKFEEFAFSFRKQRIFYILRFIILIILSFAIIKVFHQDNHKQKYNYKIEPIFPSQDGELRNAYKGQCLFSIVNSDSSKTTKTLAKKYFLSQENDSSQSTVRQLIIFNINWIDLYIDTAYFHFRSFVLDYIFFGWNSKWLTHINYLFWLYFFILHFLIYFISSFLLNSNYIVSVGRRTIIKKLDFLNDQINSLLREEIDTKNSLNYNGVGTTLNKKKSKEYPQADIRQIEKGLIEVLDDMTKMMRFISRPQFIIIFDELDKVDPKSNTNIDDKEEAVPGFESSTSGFTGGATTRVRKQNVLRLLANMKYFITTAKAKFIFITGRELYDAFLADVSDREFAISSIFHEVFYVDSFLSDDSDHNKKDITSMTEHYLCNFLMPNNYINKEKNNVSNLTLKNYNLYIKEKMFFPSAGNRKIKKEVTNEREVEKIIMLLYQFVHYLTHVSNGAPKKITNFFEKYVYSREQLCSQLNGNLYDDSLTIEIKKSNKNKFYLSFGYLDQCKIGFIHYLASPLIQAIVNNISNYGDKLLVSTSFLLDHIFKFHKNGFSWRNLEHAPEILEINRTPELRNFIKSIITFLRQTHVSQIVSGLYMFKFPKKISEEISFISKTSEEASAIFNFTLDESLSVKRHYYKMLEYYTNRYKSKEFTDSNSDFIHSIAGIHHILGDLKILDEEYTEAIFEYQDCIHAIPKNFDSNYAPHLLSHILLLTRTMLKMGLAFEKRKTYNSAYATYAEIVSLLIDFRYIDEKQLGLLYKTEITNDWMYKKAVMYKKKYHTYPETDNFRIETLPDTLNKSEIVDIIFATEGEDTIPKLARTTTRLKNKIISRLTLFDEERLMYQALLAKLFALEKNQLGGITRTNLEVTEGEFLNLHLTTNIKEKFLVSADFFKKLGDIMFYKNGLINKKSCSLFNGLDFWGYDISDDIDTYCYLNKKNINCQQILKGIKDTNQFDGLVVPPNKTLRETLNVVLLNDIEYNKWVDEYSEKHSSPQEIKKISIPSIKTEISEFFESTSPPDVIDSEIFKKVKACNCRRKDLLESGVVASCYACKYYNRALKILSENLLLQKKNDSGISKALLFFKALNNDSIFNSQRNDFLPMLASVLGGFGDIILSCSHDIDIIHEEFLDAFFTYVGSEAEKNKRFDDLKFSLVKTKIKEWSFPFPKKVSLQDLLEDKQLLFYFVRSEINENNREIAEIIDSSIIDKYAEFKNLIIKNEHAKSEKIKAEIHQFLGKSTVVTKIEKYIKKYFFYRNNNVRSNEVINVSDSWFMDYSTSHLSHLEKAILYYYISAKYYKRASNMKEAHTLYKKIIQLLLEYVSNKPSQKLVIYKYLKRIDKELVGRAIQSIYSAYDLLHVAEIQKIKWNSSVEMYENIKLENLSILADLEEVFMVYFELRLFCSSNEPSFLRYLFKSNIFSPYHLNNTVYNRLISLRLKAKMNHQVLEEILPFYKIRKHVFTPRHPIEFYVALENIEDSAILVLKEANNNSTTRLLLLEHLIIDSIFSLQKFIEVISPQNKTTLFSNSYIAAIYEELFIWTQLFEFTFMLYAFLDDEYLFLKKNDKEASICKKITEYILSREEAIGKMDEMTDDARRDFEKYKKENPSLANPLKSFKRKNINNELKFSFNLLKDKNKEYFKGRAKLFYDKLYELDKNNMYYVNGNYMAEMALKHYRNAKQMHNEGKTYKNMIEDMYFLDDDLNNDTFKFFLALERYRINTGKVNRSVNKLKDLYSNSTLFDVNNYIEMNKKN